MRNVMTAGIIVGLIAVFGLVTYSKDGNKHQADAGRYSLRWEANKIDFSVPGNVLRISLPFSDNGYPWVIGIHVDDSKPSFVNVMQAQLDESANYGIKKPNAIVNVPLDMLTIAPGAVMLNQGASGNENLIVYLVVPSGKKLILQNDAKAISQFDLKTDTIIQNGVISSQEVKGLQTLIPKLLVTQPTLATSNSPEVLKGGGGKYVTLLKGIRSHLVSSVRPQPDEASNSDGVILVKIEIDENGKVIEATSNAANERLGSICAEAVKKWVFTPFEYEKNKVKVNAIIPFYNTGQGKIISSALGDTR